MRDAEGPSGAHTATLPATLEAWLRERVRPQGTPGRLGGARNGSEGDSPGAHGTIDRVHGASADDVRAGQVWPPDLDGERPAGCKRRAGAREDLVAVVGQSDAPGLSDPVAVDLELDRELAVVRLRLELPGSAGTGAGALHAGGAAAGVGGGGDEGEATQGGGGGGEGEAPQGGGGAGERGEAARSVHDGCRMGAAARLRREWIGEYRVLRPWY